jgi:hypothetical protein
MSSFSLARMAYHIGASLVSPQDGDRTSVFQTPDSNVTIDRCRREKAIVGRHIDIIDNARMATKRTNQHSSSGVGTMIAFEVSTPIYRILDFA